MAGWHHLLNEQESEQTPGNSEGQGSLATAVHGVAKSQTWHSDWTTINCIHSILIINFLKIFLGS